MTTTTTTTIAADHDAELAQLTAEVKAAWVDLGHAIDVCDAAMGTPDAAEAEAAQDAASDRLSHAIVAMCETPAWSIAGLAAKARATTIDSGMFDDLRRSIVRDLLVIDAGAVRA
jgi:hypothetical protein